MVPQNGAAPRFANCHRYSSPAPYPDQKFSFFKRLVEFQTSVLGGVRPRKRNFCGISQFNAADQLVRIGRNPETTQLLMLADSHSIACSSSTSPTGGSANCSRLRTNTLHWPSSQIAATVTMR